MSSVTIIRRRSNLSQLIGDKGGTTVLAALRAADRETAELRDEGLGILAEAVAAVETAAGRPLAPDWLDEVYRAAADVIDVCPAEQNALYKAAFSLCELVDRQRRGGRREAAPVQVHAQSMKLLSQPGFPAEAAGPVLQGLDALLAREAAREA